jgi:alpha-ketoglutarate-dependent taurine dioxygenase
MTIKARLRLAVGSPPVMVAERPPAGLAGWLAEHRRDIDAAVAQHGAVLIRGLDVRDAVRAVQAAGALAARLMEEREAFAPRSELRPGLYSASIWPPDQPMCMHHELSYAVQVPSRQVFCCLEAPSRGGATALADAGAVLERLPPRTVKRFARHGWQLVRTHNQVIGVSWRQAFGTSDPSTVEEYCLRNGVAWDWGEDGTLRTTRRRAAILRHPGDGRPLWFNSVAFLSEWTMDPAVREYLTLEFGPDGLPFNTRYGNGEPLDQETIDLINDAYAGCTIREPWQAGDVMVVDNLRMAHSREPYEGERQVVVALADPVSVRADGVVTG